MRRLVIEFSAAQFVGNLRGQEIPGPAARLIGKIKSLEMLHVLKMVPGEFAAVVRIELKDPKSTIAEVFPEEGLQGSKLETELLDKESETVFTYFIRVKSDVHPNSGQIGQGSSIPYLSTPFEYRDGKLRITFLGNSSQIRQYLNALSKSSRIRYRIASLMDAKFPPNSPVGRLTDKQRRVLMTAYRLGYYDVPRKITAEELAGRLNLVKSTFSAHVRKAERRLFSEMLSEF